MAKIDPCNDPDKRRETAATAKEIMDRMSVFMGGAPA
jgi:hypothetical protein